MSSFIPPDMSADGGYDDDDNNMNRVHYPLSQFDVELQQQAQLALQQEADAWQDFENYFPLVDPFSYTPPVTASSTQQHTKSAPSVVQNLPDTNATQSLSTPTDIPMIDGACCLLNGQIVDLVKGTVIPVDPNQFHLDLPSPVKEVNLSPSPSLPTHNPSTSSSPWPVAADHSTTTPRVKMEYQDQDNNNIPFAPTPRRFPFYTPPSQSSQQSSTPTLSQPPTLDQLHISHPPRQPSPLQPTNQLQRQQQLSPQPQQQQQQQQQAYNRAHVPTSIALPEKPMFPMNQFLQNQGSTPSSETTPPSAATDMLSTPFGWNQLSPSAETPPVPEKVAIQRLKSPVMTGSNHSSAASTPLGGGKQQKKTAHNAIERRYRNNINDRIAELKNAVPALLYAKLKDSRTGSKRSHRAAMEEEDDDGEDAEEYLDGVAVATKLNKATILRKAIEYINHLKRTGEHARRENTVLQQLLAQMPHGQEVLARYRVQKSLREEELNNQLMKERALQKQEQKNQKAARRGKRSRTGGDHEGDDDSSSAASADPITPPGGVSHRVLMAAFMAISFFSNSPLTAGPMSANQYQDHRHSSRTESLDTDPISSNSPNPPPAPMPRNDDFVHMINGSSPSFFGSLFPMSDGWSALRTTVFIICIIQLFFPVIRYWFSSASFKVKRVRKQRRSFVNTSERSATRSTGSMASVGMTPGDQKCMQIYTILVKALEREGDAPPVGSWAVLSALTKEVARFVSRHWFGYEILYDDHEYSPQEEWTRACKWIKLNEVTCLGGKLDVTRWSMLHMCFQVVNIVEMLDDEEHDYADQARARVYATAAMQMALMMPIPTVAQKLAQYFWHQAMYEANCEDDNLMRSLVFDCHQDDGEDRMEEMLNSRAWKETLEVMQHQMDKSGFEQGLSLSLTAPVLVPVAILSTFHLLDNLQTQFGRLIISITATPLNSSATNDADAEFNETAFDQIFAITSPCTSTAGGVEEDHQRLAHWLAAVGCTIEALWRGDVAIAEELASTLMQKIPKSVVARDPEDKSRINQLDELIKTCMVHVLLGAAWLKKQGQEIRGVDELWKAEDLRLKIKKILAHIHKHRTPRRAPVEDSEVELDLESSVVSLAEFVVAMIGLEAWVSAWQLARTLTEKDVRQNWERDITEQIRHSTLTLRRMIRRHSLDGLRTNQAIVDRLSRLGNFVSRQLDELDSSYERSDDSEGFLDDDDELHIDTSEFNNDELLTLRTEKALDILRGLS